MPARYVALSFDFLRLALTLLHPPIIPTAMAMALRIFVRGLCDEISANTRQLSELLAAYRMVVYGNSVNVRLSTDIATIAASLPGFSLERLGTELRALLRIAEYDLRRFVNNDQVRHSIIMRDHILHIIGLCLCASSGCASNSVHAQHRNNVLCLLSEIARDCLHHCIDGAAAVNGYLGPIGVMLEVIRFDDVQVSRLRPVCRSFNRIAKTLLAQQSRGWALLLTFIDEFGLPHVCRHVVRVTSKFPVSVLLRHYQDACLSVRTACRDTIARHCISGNCRKFQLSTKTAGVECSSIQSTMAYFCGLAQPRCVEIQFGASATEDVSAVLSVLVRAA